MKIRSYAAGASLLRLLVEPRQAIRLHELVRRPGEAVQLEVAPGPVEIRARHVHGGRRDRAAAHGVHGCGAGVCEQVQEALPSRQRPHPLPREAMVEKQAGVEIIGEVDEEAVAALAHDVKLRLRIELLVLLAAALAAAHAQDACAPRGTPSTSGSTDSASSRRARAASSRDGGRRRVFLHADPALVVAVDVDGERVLGHVGIVDAIARDVVASRPVREAARSSCAAGCRTSSTPGTHARRLEPRAPARSPIRLDGRLVQFGNAAGGTRSRR